MLYEVITGPERREIVRRMNRILQDDAPWIFGFHPKSYTLGHAWLYNRKPNDVANNILKYQRVDIAERARRRYQWNAPVRWPLALAGVGLVLFIVPAVVAYRRRERSAARRTNES